MIQKQPILSIILIVAVLLLPFLDILEVTIMEARNYITAREMLTDGHWILTTMNGEARYQKPPLPTWLTALSGMIFGIKNIWALRLPAVLMIMLLGTMLYTLSRKLTLSKQHSFLNGLIGITSFYVTLIIFEAPWDIYAHVFMLVAIYSIIQVFISERIRFKYILLTIVFIGCSILSKGPISVYALLIPFLISYSVVYRKEIHKKKWITVPIILILGLALGFSWYFYVRYVDPDIFNAITAKETGNWTSYNVRPFYYYWSFFTQSGIWTIPAFISLLYPYLKTRVSNLKMYQFTLLWTLLIVVLLSIIPEKKSRYLMPVLIPLAINAGFYIEYLIRRFKELKDKRETIPVYFSFGVIGLAFFNIPLVFVYLVIAEEKLNVPIVTFILLGLLSVVGVLLLKKLYQKSIKHVIVTLIVGVVLIIYSLGVLRSHNKIVNVGYSDFDDFVQYHNIESSKTIYAYQNITPEMIWSSGRKIKVINSLHDLPEGTVFYVLDCYGCRFNITTDKDINNFLYETPYPIDLNYEFPTSGNYKDRKVGYVYKLTIPK
ncbi:phospholipid carrier-dependent glycosyltransferase [Dokdonia sp.]|uniref:ArnT family glycosyltransferase n=1 Tax=Dokdonia sp. TaxID=2024995 RepID=UPI003263EC10